MITVTFFEDASGRVERLECVGHADYAPRDRDDIVCAGVSTVLQMVSVGLRRLHALGPSSMIDSGNVTIGVIRTGGHSSLGWVLLDAAEESLRAIARSYNVPEAKYVQVDRVRL